MGWTNSHLHQFISGKGFGVVYYGEPSPEFADMGSEMLNERRCAVADLAPEAKQKFIYEYDFGDGWYHEVVVEKILPPDPAFKHPLCLAGAMACPPEDCGGIYGYYNLLEIVSNPTHPQHDEMKEWIGGKLNPEEFEIEIVNEIFKKLKA